MNKLSEDILAKIKDEGIEQRPRWHFIALEITFWIFFAVSVYLGARAFAVIVFALSVADFDVFGGMTHPPLRFVFYMLPLFWFAFFALFLLLAILAARHLKNAYRFSLAWIIGGNLLLSIVLGGALAAFGGGERFERVFAERMPFYQGIEKQHMMMWQRPQEGLLSGIIIELQSDKVLILEDFGGQIWTVDFAEAFVAPRLELAPALRVRIIGEQTTENGFRAAEIRPGMMMRGRGGMMMDWR